ncbi:MAG: ATP-binding protein [Deltaproteobacteria bacterium]|nr:ATP-binding protein [Deltaproteobacteria bacterium]
MYQKKKPVDREKRPVDREKRPADREKRPAGRIIPVLPTSMQNFEELRKKKAIYVDKTMFFPLLSSTSKIIFCSRPRRFGKTLTVHTLDSYFSGKKELFQGLAVENLMSSPEFITHPVVRLDMSSAADSSSIQIFGNSLMGCLESNAKRNNVSLRDSDPVNAFKLLLEDIHNATGEKVVLLIDEYDAPMIKLVQRDKLSYDDVLLSQTRIVMERFYSQIKSSDENLEFVFITGVTKFAKMGVFSQLNTLIDISLMPEFADFIGYTQKELETNFSFFLNKTARKLKIRKKQLLLDICDYYDGFSFDGNTRMYNPVSVLSFFIFNDYRNYWMESGSNNLIKKFLLEKTLTVDQFEGMKVTSSFVSNPGEIQITPPHGFLYQSGYLTLRSQNPGNYTLHYPNREVRSGISALFLENLNLSYPDIGTAGRELAMHLAVCDIQGIVDVFHQLLAGICYHDHLIADSSSQENYLDNDIRENFGVNLSDESIRQLSAALSDRIRKKTGEGFYRTILQACLWMAGAKVVPEKSENIGRLDLEVVFGGLTYVMELKMSDDIAGGHKAARAGMIQIHDRGYGLASGNPVLVSLAIGRKERNIVSCLFEKNGHEMCVLTQGHWKYLTALSRKRQK